MNKVIDIIQKLTASGVEFDIAFRKDEATFWGRQDMADIVESEYMLNGNYQIVIKDLN